jgi:hypothetical protein
MIERRLCAALMIERIVFAALMTKYVKVRKIPLYAPLRTALTFELKNRNTSI